MTSHPLCLRQRLAAPARRLSFSLLIAAIASAARSRTIWSFSGNGSPQIPPDRRAEESCRLAPGKILNALQKLAEIALADGIGSVVDLIRGAADIFAGLRDLVVKFASRAANRSGDTSSRSRRQSSSDPRRRTAACRRARDSVFRVFLRFDACSLTCRVTSSATPDACFFRSSASLLTFFKGDPLRYRPFRSVRHPNCCSTRRSCCPPASRSRRKWSG